MHSTNIEGARYDLSAMAAGESRVISIQGGQGSVAWKAHRRPPGRDGTGGHYNASDAPAMMNASPYETRRELIDRLESGVDREFSDWVVDHVLEPGHAFEARARELVEALTGEDLARVVYARGWLSASLDGRMFGGVDWEHKRLNAALRDILPATVPLGQILPAEYGARLPLHHRIQIAQEQHCSGAERTLFSATDWAEDGTMLDARHCWVERDQALIDAVVAGWQQLHRDRATHEAIVPKAPVLLPAMPELPAATIQTSGVLVVLTNLPKMIVDAREYVAKIPREPSTDAEFAQCAAAIKRLGEVRKGLDAAVVSAMSGIADIQNMQTLAAELGGIFDSARLFTEKLVESRRVARRTEELQRGDRLLLAYVAEINGTLAPDVMPRVPVDFAGCIKGLRLDSFRNAIDAELARARVDADKTAARIRANGAAITAAGLPALFADRAQLVVKDPEAVAAIVAGRVAAHKAAEERRLEAERARIRAEEEARAVRLAAERARIAEQERLAAADKAAQDSQRQESEGASALAHQTAVAPSAGAQAEGAAVDDAAAAPGMSITPNTQSGSLPGTPGPFAGVTAAIAPAASIGSTGSSAGALAALPPRRLADICEALGCDISAKQLAAYGVRSTRDAARALLVAAADIPTLKQAMRARIDAL